MPMVSVPAVGATPQEHGFNLALTRGLSFPHDAGRLSYPIRQPLPSVIVAPVTAAISNTDASERHKSPPNRPQNADSREGRWP